MLYSIDHIYSPKKDVNLPTVILYSDIDAPEFGVFHRRLKKLADNWKIKYVFRHFKRVLFCKKKI